MLIQIQMTLMNNFIRADASQGSHKSICIGKYIMIPKIIGIIFGLLAVGIFAWKFKETPLCRP